MTNYNDGKWHGWNGGECPVHPKTTVTVKWSCNGVETGEVPASGVCTSWIGRAICAFRVVKEHKEPREFWIVDGCAYSHPQSGYDGIHVREVLE